MLSRRSVESNAEPKNAPSRLKTIAERFGLRRASSSSLDSSSEADAQNYSWKQARILKGHADWVTDVSGHCGPSTFLVSASRDCTVRLWRPDGNEAEWQCEAAVRSHSDFVTCCDTSADGSTVASGGEDWGVNIYDVGRFSDGAINSYTGHSYAVRCCSFGRGDMGDLIATGSDDETVRIWDMRKKYGGRVATVRCGSQVLTTRLFSNILVAGGGTARNQFAGSSEAICGGWLRAFDVRTWRVIGDFKANDSFLASVGKRLSSTSLLGTDSSRMWEGEAESREAPDRSEGDGDRGRMAHSGGAVLGCDGLEHAGDGSVSLVSVGDDFIHGWHCSGTSISHSFSVRCPGVFAGACLLSDSLCTL